MKVEVGRPMRDAADSVTLLAPSSRTLHHQDQVSASPESLPAIDDIDNQLIALLLDDGRLGNRALAAKVGVSEATVGIRLRRLVAHGVLVFTTLVDWEAAGYEWFAIARIAVEGRSPSAVADDLATLSGCIAASVVFGSVDVLAYFLLEDREDIHRLVDEDLARVEGIATFNLDLATESFITKFGGNTFLAKKVPALRLPSPSVPLDELDVGLLEQLLKDGRKASRQIGRELGVSEGTIRARMSRLSQARLLKPVAMIDPLATGAAGVIADVGLHVRRDAVSRVIEQLLEIPEVVFAAVTVGSVDIAVAVAAPSRVQLLEIVLDRIRGLDGVRSTETLEMVNVVQFVPYFKRLL
jgi:DNA-binding Lrp family transcriptional regulator